MRKWEAKNMSSKLFLWNQNEINENNFLFMPSVQIRVKGKET